ncbi:hypothetical protein Hanom_Chr12g01086151 [Helianthus anomalus]
MPLTHTFDGIGLRFRTRDYQIFQPEVLPEVIPVVIEVRDRVLAPPAVKAATRQTQIEAPGLVLPHHQAQLRRILLRLITSFTTRSRHCRHLRTHRSSHSISMKTCL